MIYRYLHGLQYARPGSGDDEPNPVSMNGLSSFSWRFHCDDSKKKADVFVSFSGCRRQVKPSQYPKTVDDASFNDQYNSRGFEPYGITLISTTMESTKASDPDEKLPRQIYASEHSHFNGTYEIIDDGRKKYGGKSIWFNKKMDMYFWFYDRETAWKISKKMPGGKPPGQGWAWSYSAAPQNCDTPSEADWSKTPSGLKLEDAVAPVDLSAPEPPSVSEDDVLHTERMPELRKTLSAEDSELLLTYLTVPYAPANPPARSHLPLSCKPRGSA